jgi:hypothetical protein
MTPTELSRELRLAEPDELRRRRSIVGVSFVGVLRAVRARRG